jgi:hypothetical protein
MKQKSIISSITLISSLTAYFYAKHTQKDPVPVVMVSGFFGAMLAEAMFNWFGNGDDRDDKSPPPQFN